MSQYSRKPRPISCPIVQLSPNLNSTPDISQPSNPAGNGESCEQPKVGTRSGGSFELGSFMS